MIRFTEKITQDLIRWPESGMGYQFVEVKTSNDEVKRGIAYNAELLLFEREPDVIKVAARYSALAERAQSSKDTIKNVRVLSRAEIYPLYEGGTVRFAASLSKNKSGGAADAPEEETIKSEVFKRFTAYRNDNRITASGGLLPGTYATTEQDARNVRTGEEAVERYALPDPRPAVFVFTAKPPEKTRVKRGVVQPDFGRKGGGEEIIFVNGSPSKTVTGPDIIPPR